ncbi:MAG: hypothetical protein Q8Q03_00735 [bacterium]|nr:hypothetical protein [bacterium]
MPIALKKEIMLEGSPWGRGFAVGLVLAMVLLLPLFFVMALFGPFDRPQSSQVSLNSKEAVRDFSSMPAVVYNDYLEN